MLDTYLEPFLYPLIPRFYDTFYFMVLKLMNFKLSNNRSMQYIPYIEQLGLFSYYMEELKYYIEMLGSRIFANSIFP